MCETNVNLRDLYGNNEMRMQSSMMYKALRGEDMRVIPLVRNKERRTSREELHVTKTSDRTASNPVKTNLRPATVSAIFRASKFGDIHDLKAEFMNEQRITESSKVSSARQSPDTTENQENATRSLKEFKKRGLSTKPFSAEAQRMPFRSTELEKQHSRESLKEEEDANHNKPGENDASSKPQKNKKCASLKPKNVEDPAMISNSTSVKRITVKKGKQNEKKKASLVGRSIMERTAKKPIGVSMNIATENANKTDHPSKFQATSTFLPEPVNSKRIAKKNKKKNLWIPTSEAVESWNQFSSDSKVKMSAPRKRNFARKAKKKQFAKKDAVIVKIETPNSVDEDDDTEEDASVTESEEGANFGRQEELRRDLEQKSTAFFNQFKYGEVLRSSIPRFRFHSDITPDVGKNKMLSTVDVRIRLTDLDESVLRVKNQIRRWTSFIMTMNEPSKVEKIKETLTHAQFILDRKVKKARDLLKKYMDVDDAENDLPSIQEMEDAKYQSELVQLDVNSLKRLFESHEKLFNKPP